jgi:hypothetical protein
MSGWRIHRLLTELLLGVVTEIIDAIARFAQPGMYLATLTDTCSPIVGQLACKSRHCNPALSAKRREPR